MPFGGTRQLSSTPAAAGPSSSTSTSTFSHKGATNPVLIRYRNMVMAGELHDDPSQWELVQQLARLYDEICAYRYDMEQHAQRMTEYQERRLVRLQELLEEEQQRMAEEEAARREAEARAEARGGGGGSGGKGGAGTSSSIPTPAAWTTWLSDTWGRLAGEARGGAAGGAGGGGGGGARPSALHRERLAALQREEQVRDELGPPPEPPEPPKGMYVWGSVGSGKSLLVSLLYGALQQGGQLPAMRWMHFNAAMLEVHSRLHHLDVERWRLRDLHEQQRVQAEQRTAAGATGGAAAAGAGGGGRAVAGGAGGAGQQVSASGGLVQGGGGGGAAGGGLPTRELVAYEESLELKGAPGDADDSDSDDEDDIRGGGAQAAGGGGAQGKGKGQRQRQREEEEGDEALPPQTSAEQQGVLRYWDPQVQRQREAKAAVLAIRRHMRLARAGRYDPRALGASNSQGLVRMAASFIRGTPGDTLSGWAGGTGPLASVLYFDEVQVTDVFSAVALKGLVEALTSAGCVVLCTSNRAPGDLPPHGLHADMWAHFVNTLLERCQVYELSGQHDYRRRMLEEGRAALAARGPSSAGAHAPAAAGAAGAAAAAAAAGAAGAASWPPVQCAYFHPAGPQALGEMEALWAAATAGAPGSGQPASVPVMFGRTLQVPRASADGSAAWFRFEQLCAATLGPADYVALATSFPVVFLEDIPAMSMNVRDKARRFITLVDELYNSRCLLVASAQVAPDGLFVGPEGSGQEPILDLEGLQFETAVEDAKLRRDSLATGSVAPVASTPAALTAAMGALGGVEERFAFRRAVSRLYEMQSPQYITAAVRMRQQQRQEREARQEREQRAGAAVSAVA